MKKKNYGNSNISPCQNKNKKIFKKSSKRNQKNPSRYYNSTNLSHVSTKPKISSFQKSSHKNRPSIT